MVKNKFYLLVGVIIVSAFVLAGCLHQGGQTTNTNVGTDGEQGSLVETDKQMAAALTINLDSQNNSGQLGTATLTEVNGQTEVVINLSGAPADVAQPAHIHLSACPTIGAVKYPLTSLTNGQSKTVLAVALDEILNNLPLAINVHKSAAEASVYVACGEIKKSDEAMMEDKKDEAMMEDKKDEAMMEDKKDEAMMESQTKTFNITAKDFSFSQTEIKVKKGDKVKIVLSNTDGFHDWTLAVSGVATTQIPAGQTASVEFVADQTGTFEYYCSVGSHRQLGMKGNLIVE